MHGWCHHTVWHDMAGGVQRVFLAPDAASIRGVANEFSTYYGHKALWWDAFAGHMWLLEGAMWGDVLAHVC
jgi:hypothetical protein